MRRDTRKIGNRPQRVSLGIGAAHQDGEGIVEAERCRPSHLQVARVRRGDETIDAIRIGERRLLQDCRERGARVFDVEVDVEYTGTAFTAILKQPPIADPDSVYRFVAAAYARDFKLRWTAPLGFNNTFAILVRRIDAERYGLRSIGDLARVAPQWKAGFGYEFLERADGFTGLAKLYGLRFSQPPTAMDLGLTYRALADRRVDVIAGNSTDGQIAALDLVALSDDRGYFPPYQAAPVVRAAVLEKYPAVGAALAELAGKISDAEMRQLNALADVEHKDIAEIARAWLAERVP